MNVPAQGSVSGDRTTSNNNTLWAPVSWFRFKISQIQLSFFLTHAILFLDFDIYVCYELTNYYHLFRETKRPTPAHSRKELCNSCLWIRKKLLIPRNSEEHEHEWILNIGIMAKNWPAPPKIFTIWRHPSEAGHKKETRRLVQSHQKSSVNVICQALLLTTCPLFLSSASLSPRPLETSSPTLPSGSQTSVLSKQPMLFAPLSNMLQISSTNHGGKKIHLHYLILSDTMTGKNSGAFANTLVSTNTALRPRCLEPRRCLWTWATAPALARPRC